MQPKELLKMSCGHDLYQIVDQDEAIILGKQSFCHNDDNKRLREVTVG